MTPPQNRSASPRARRPSRTVAIGRGLPPSKGLSGGIAPSLSLGHRPDPDDDGAEQQEATDDRHDAHAGEAALVVFTVVVGRPQRGGDADAGDDQDEEAEDD